MSRTIALACVVLAVAAGCSDGGPAASWDPRTEGAKSAARDLMACPDDDGALPRSRPQAEALAREYVGLRGLPLLLRCIEEVGRRRVLYRLADVDPDDQLVPGEPSPGRMLVLADGSRVIAVGIEGLEYPAGAAYTDVPPAFEQDPVRVLRSARLAAVDHCGVPSFVVAADDGTASIVIEPPDELGPQRRPEAGRTYDLVGSGWDTIVDVGRGLAVDIPPDTCDDTYDWFDPEPDVEATFDVVSGRLLVDEIAPDGSCARVLGRLVGLVVESPAGVRVQIDDLDVAHQHWC